MTPIRRESIQRKPRKVDKQILQDALKILEKYQNKNTPKK